MGQIYEIGTAQIPQDINMSFQLYSKAAESGDMTAEYNLGVYYQYGMGVAADKEKSAHFLERAAKQGDPSAMLNLGLLNQEGINGQPDYQKAMICFEKAHKQSLSSDS